MEKDALRMNHAMYASLSPTAPAGGTSIEGEEPESGLWVSVLVPLLPTWITLEK